jgi:gamma-glutamylcyclotransferase (GGCT)/AIG2-like uncharacterized protein YtfP
MSWETIIGREIAKKVVQEGNWTAIWNALTFRSTRVRTFKEPEDGSYNTDFYDYFIKRIESAKREIYITGDGFNFTKNSEGEVIARKFIEAYRVALKNGVTITRLQTESKSNDEWVKLIGDLIEEFPDTFHLNVIREVAGGQLLSICVIDPNDARNCVVELMLTTRRRILSEEVGLAAVAIFIERSRSVAEQLSTRITKLAKSSACLSISDRKLAKIWLSNRVHYFCYGANMNQEQIKERVGDVDLIGNGILQGFDIDFPRKGTYRDGAVASIVAKPGTSVHGIIYALSANQMKRMDEIEDIAAYERQPVTVLDGSGQSWDCVAHVAFPENSPPAPDKAYVELIVQAAKEMGLPAAYLDRLNEINV